MLPLLLLLLLLRLQSDTTLASRLFAALGAEPAGSRTALQEALGGLAAAMGAGIQATPGTAAAQPAAAAAAGSGGLAASKVEELEKLLLSSISSDQVGLRGSMAYSCATTSEVAASGGQLVSGERAATWPAVHCAARGALFLDAALAC
jgi:hypothetical protein